MSAMQRCPGCRKAPSLLRVREPKAMDQTREEESQMDMQGLWREAVICSGTFAHCWGSSQFPGGS
ncbi:RIKEN cDNA 3010026O09, isoform CRA_a [Mus musculus]|nr:RIKEN cDNA 3010026O09, isoform CRA_a [Mus musculus]